MVDTESTNPDYPAPKQPYDDDVRTLFLPGLEASAAQARADHSSFLTPARLGTLLVILAALGLGWLCMFGPLAAPLEETLTRLAAGLPSLTPTGSPIPLPTFTPLPASPTSLVSPTPTRTTRPAQTPLPTSTSTPAIPPTATLSPTPTSPVSGCTASSQVTLQDVGSTLCVTGWVLRISAQPSSFSIFVEDPADAFYFVSYDRVWEDLEEDTCVYATGEIRQLGNNPIMLLSYKVPLEYCP